MLLISYFPSSHWCNHFCQIFAVHDFCIYRYCTVVAIFLSNVSSKIQKLGLKFPLFWENAMAKLKFRTPMSPSSESYSCLSDNCNFLPPPFNPCRRWNAAASVSDCCECDSVISCYVLIKNNSSLVKIPQTTRHCVRTLQACS